MVTIYGSVRYLDCDIHIRILGTLLTPCWSVDVEHFGRARGDRSEMSPACVSDIKKA